MALEKSKFNQLKKSIAKTLGSAETDFEFTDPKDWISTGSRLLDYNICQGKVAGIPVGKVTEIAGLNSAGKSFMSAIICANAQKKGIVPIYIDSEFAVQEDLLKKAGVDIEQFVIISQNKLETIFATVESVMKDNVDTRFLFVLDSLANCITDDESEESNLTKTFNPHSFMGQGPKVAGKGFRKLLKPLWETQSTMVVVNHLKDNISADRYEMMINPYRTPFGSAPAYAYSLRLWLTKARTKDGRLETETGDLVGNKVRVENKKNRFGRERRKIDIILNWGDDSVSISDEQLWFEALKDANCPHIVSGQRNTLKYEDGTEEKFYSKDFLSKLKEPKFAKRIEECFRDTFLYATASDQVPQTETDVE